MADPFHLAWKKAEDIDGWLYEREAKLLWDLCESPWCEIGSHRGRSAIILASRSNPGYCIDWFRDRPGHMESDERAADIEASLRKNMKPFEVKVFAKRFQDVHERIPEGLAFLHLDADHSFDGTEEAFNLYAPKVKRGGYMVIHDAWHEGWHEDPSVKELSAWPDVPQFLNEVLFFNQCWEHVCDVERSAAFRKR